MVASDNFRSLVQEENLVLVSVENIVCNLI